LLKSITLFAVANVAFLFTYLQLFLKVFLFFFSFNRKVFNNQAPANLQLLNYCMHFNVFIK